MQAISFGLHLSFSKLAPHCPVLKCIFELHDVRTLPNLTVRLNLLLLAEKLMFADEQIIKADVGSKKLVDEKTLLVRRLEEVEKEVQLLKQCEEFLQRMARLDKYLQVPDQASDYGKYELAAAALSR
jgi:hypothetical protein